MWTNKTTRNLRENLTEEKTSFYRYSVFPEFLRFHRDPKTPKHALVNKKDAF